MMGCSNSALNGWIEAQAAYLLAISRTGKNMAA
jgi:hypothetical protein